jgi:ubiquinone/menaquinone biosynthesis C-methylase UbiE
MEESFSHVASAYDRDFTHSSIGLKQRKQVYKSVLPLLNNRMSVLEINGGTGEDALLLAKHCKTVLTTDISPEMVNIAQAKTAHLPNVKTLVIDINKLEVACKEEYDLLFSNFGGLNCLSPNELKKFMDTSINLIKPHGFLIAVIMGRKTLWERFYFWVKSDTTKSRRRRNKSAVETNVDGKKVSTWYYSPKEIEAISPKGFRMVNLKPIGLFVPPSYLQAYFNNKKNTLGFLHFMDSLFGSLWSDYADHYCICYQKQA